MSLLATKNLYKHFDGVKAVDHLSVAFEEGKVTGVVGPNGSGKSTLVNALTGLVPIDGGEVLVSSATTLRSIQTSEVAEYEMTRTFQDVRLFEQIPVIDNVLVVLTRRSVWGSLFEKHKEFHHEQAKMALERVGLWEKRNELAKNLSYGQRKLLEIARVLAMVEARGIKLVFLDEPFAGLFPEMVKLVISIVKELRTQGKSVVLIEHNMDIIRELSDHLYVLDAGKLLAEGNPEEVLRQKDVIEAYLGE
ncbi:MAG: ATP-binding cassette domain-containing protein [Patescibacteria group bacterium]